MNNAPSSGARRNEKKPVDRARDDDGETDESRWARTRLKGDMIAFAKSNTRRVRPIKT